MTNAKPVIEQVSKAYGSISGRSYGLVEPYNMEKAELAIVILGSTAGTAKSLLDDLNDPRLGLLKIRTFRPFPTEEIAANLRKCKAVAVLDRAASFGSIGGPVFSEARAALYDEPKRPQIVNYIYGLGGRDTTTDMLKTVYDDLDTVAKTGKPDPVQRFLGLRDD